MDASVSVARVESQVKMGGGTEAFAGEVTNPTSVNRPLEENTGGVGGGGQTDTEPRGNELTALELPVRLCCCCY